MATSATGWSDAQKLALVQQIITGGVSLSQAHAQYGLSTKQLEEWVHLFRRTVRQALDHQLSSTLSLAGMEVGELSRGEFSGKLADIGVADLLQTIQMGRKDACITLTHHGTQSHVWCQGGEIVDAKSGGLDAEEAVYKILSVEDGSIVADFSPVHRPRRITVSTPRLLLQAASHNDQRAELLRRIGDPGRVFSIRAEVAAKGAADLEREELDVLRMFDGCRSLDDALSSSGLPQARALDIAVRLYEQGLLALRAEPNPTRRTRPLPAPSHVTMSYRPFAGTPLGPARPPTWVLACGALFCSSLGAVTAIAYADTLEFGNAPRDPLGAGSSAASGATAAPVASAVCPREMALLAGGQFSMGTDSRHPALDLARPAHPVSVDSFCIGRHEVTAQEYEACTEQGQCTPAHHAAHFVSEEPGGESDDSGMVHAQQCNAKKGDRERHPINCISHDQAARYCSAVGGRLPSEAEWEFAARGPSSQPFPWGEVRPTAEHVNACGKECARWHSDVGLAGEVHGLMYEEDDGYSGTAPVGSFPLGSSRDGVMDLIGNVFEWTRDGLYSYGRDASVNPAGPSASESFVIRGGNFNSAIAEFSDPALRFSMNAESYSHGVGFRCAREPRHELGQRDAAEAPPGPSTNDSDD